MTKKPKGIEPTKRDLAWIGSKLAGLLYGRVEVTVVDSRIVRVVRMDIEQAEQEGGDLGQNKPGGGGGSARRRP